MWKVSTPVPWPRSGGCGRRAAGPHRKQTRVNGGGGGGSVKATTLVVLGSPETEGPRSRASSVPKAFHGNTDPNQVPD